MRKSCTLVLLALLASRAHGESQLNMRACDEPGATCTTASPLRRALGTAAAIVPGILVHGTGSFITGELTTAKRLLTIEAIGASMMVVGGLPIGLTGGSPYTLPLVPVLIAGTGLFFSSWLADIYGTAGAGNGVPRARTPWSVEVGGMYVTNAYRDRAIGRIAARVTEGPLELSATGLLSHDQRFRGGDLAARVRIFGAPATGEVVRSGSYLDVRATGRARDDADDRVQVATFEADVIGRLDTRAISDSLTGSFVELALGGGMERAAFVSEDETGGLLITRFAYGAYLGRRGEAQLFYDHRRDSFAGGIAAGRAAGFIGSVGAIVDARVSGPWAVHAEFEIGSAWVTTVGLRYQGGPP